MSVKGKKEEIRGKYGPPLLERGLPLPLCPKKPPKGTYVMGIDPGFGGAFVVTDGGIYFRYEMMPTIGEGDYRRIDFIGATRILRSFLDDHWAPQIFLERAIPMAMGAKGAFSYGRGFEALILAIETAGIAFTLIEPSKWTKEMHQGISADLKAKAKSLIAVKRLFPKLVEQLPLRPKGGIHDGPIDALLIAAYGLRTLGRNHSEPSIREKVMEANIESVGDFY